MRFLGYLHDYMHSYMHIYSHSLQYSHKEQLKPLKQDFQTVPARNQFFVIFYNRPDLKVRFRLVGSVFACRALILNIQ